MQGSPCVTPNDIIDGLLDREGEGDPAKGYRDPHDRGGRTSWGISERAHPEAWKDGPPSRERAAEIYRLEYISPWDWVAYDPLRVQLIDCHVLHGKTGAVRLLQQALGTRADGVLGINTAAAYDNVAARLSMRLLNNSLVAWRLKFFDDLTDRNASQKRFEEGWSNRALVFLV